MKRMIIPFATICTLLVKCADSPLSDIEITGFDVIEAEFHVLKTFWTSSTSHSTCAYLWDKNHNAIRIKNGTVKVNGVELAYDQIFKWYNTPVSDVPVSKNSLYTFVITLPNGDTCVSRITTPPAEFGTVSYPNPIHILQDTAISCSDFSGSGNSLLIDLQVDSDADTISYYGPVLYQNIPDNGRFALTHDLFNPAYHTGNGLLKLKRITGAQASGKLRGGSTIVADFEFSRNVTMTQ
jgi:hypothetical protein